MPSVNVERLAGVLARLQPGRDLDLRPGVAPAELAALASGAGPVPDDLASLWRWADGQRPGAGPLVDTALRGELQRLTRQGRLLSVSESRRLAKRGWIPVFVLDEDNTQGIDLATGALVFDGPGGPAAVRAAGAERGVGAWVAALEAIDVALHGPWDADESARRWVLAVSGVLGRLWNRHFDVLGYAPRPEASRSPVIVLRRDWGVTTPADVARVVDDLFRRASAWDLGRAAAVAEWAYAGWLWTEDEAWSALLRIARRVREQYASWEAFGRAYLASRDRFFAEDTDDDSGRALDWLLADPASPWRLLPWNTPLPDDLAPPPPPATDRLEVFDAAGLTRALEHALPGDVVLLAPGRYEGAFAVNDPVWVEATAPGVLLASDGASPVLSVFRPAVVRGVTIEGAPGVDSVVLAATFARFDGCAVRGGGDGFLAAFAEEGTPDWAFQLHRVRVEDVAGPGVRLLAGYLRVEGSAIARTGGDGVRVADVALGVRIDDSSLDGCAKAGVFAKGPCEVSIERTTVTGTAGPGVTLQGGADGRLEEVVVRAARGAGLQVATGAHVVAQRCRFEECAGANLDLADAAPSTLIGCQLLGGPWAGAWIHPAGAHVLIDTVIEGSRLAALYVDGAGPDGAKLAMLSAHVGASREGGALYVANGAQVHATDSVFHDCPLALVEVAGGSTLGVDSVTATLGKGSGVLVHSGSSLAGRGLTVTEVADTALWVAAGRARLERVDLLRATRGLVVGEGSRVLARDLAVRELRGGGTDAPDVERGLAVLVGEKSRLALLGGLGLGGTDDAVQVIGGSLLAAQGLHVLGAKGVGVLVGSGSKALLRGGFLPSGAHPALLVQGGGEARLWDVAVDPQAVRAQGGHVQDGPPAPVRAGTLEGGALVLERDVWGPALEAWGEDASALAALARTVGARELRAGVEVEEDEDEVTCRGLGADRLADALGVLLGDEGALGLVLAEPRPADDDAEE